MPLYTYKCNRCKKKKVQYRLVENRDSHTKCKCKKGTLIRQIDSSSFILKGNCWSKDGYSKNKKQ